ncbi:MAG: creatininase family protein [Gemmatimonadetes bacterium]|nr:creatininase family protein [Gemmatimonadota bacterium]
MFARATTLVAIAAGAFTVGAGTAQTPGASPAATNPDPNMPRPIAAHESVFLEELTWLEVRDAIRSGKTTVIVATGGIEQNGPYLVLGKHNVVLRATTEAIAEQLGNALVAPIIAFVPEGDIDPPTGHMRYPGTISLTEETYQRLLTDIANSLRKHGFTHVILIGDSGGNQRGMRAVADALSATWAGTGTGIHFIPEYYDYPGVYRWLESQGVHQVDEGYHDDFQITSTMMTVEPLSVRMPQRVAAGRFSINGVNLAPAESTIAWGRRVVAWRADKTVEAIRRAISR